MSHPLLRVVCLYAVGVLLGSSGDLGWAWLLAPLIGLSLASVFLTRVRPVLYAGLLVFAGWLNLTCHTRIWSAHDLRHVVTEEAILADVRGRLTETPRITLHLRNGEPRLRSLAELEVMMLRTPGSPYRAATGRLAVSSPGALSPAFHQGQRVEISGVLATPDGPLAEGLFDYATYLKRRGVYFQLRVSGTNDWSLGEGSVSTAPFTDQFVRWARQTLSRGLPDDDPATGLLQAMTLGWKTALTDEIEQPFMKSGTMHIFAISGLHIALIAGILLSVLRLLRLPRGVCGVLLIPMLWFYTAATGWQASAVRATVMMTIILGGWSLRRPSNLLNSLAGAGLLILLWDPLQLFQASFQLSFAVVLSLSLLLPPLQERLLRALQPDSMLPTQLVPRWKRWLGTPSRWVLLTAATSFAAWLGSMPLSAQYFHLFSPGTLLANLLLVPCASAALASALASLAAGAWWPWLSEVFNHGAWFWMHIMMRVSEGVSELPGAYRFVAPPSPALLTVYYGTLLLLAFVGPTLSRLKPLLAGSALLMAALLLWQLHTHRSSAAVTVIPLNGGMAVHVKAPGQNKPSLVDCGHTNTFSSVLMPFLHARGNEAIRTLVITHGDVRHMGSARLVLEEFSPEQLGASTVRFRSGAYRDLVENILPDGVELNSLKPGDHIEGWDVLHPPAGLKVRRANEGALVLRGVIQGTRLLLLSDLDRPGQRLLLTESDPELLRSHIVVTGLPEEGEPLIPDLLEGVQPSLIIVCDDEWPPSRRAPAELLARLRESGAEVLNTREAGAIKLEFTADDWKALNALGGTLAQPHTAPRLED